MIVTFHVAVYFVYYIWNTYISRQTNESQSIQNSNGPSGSNGRGGTNNPHERNHGTNSSLAAGTNEVTNGQPNEESSSSPRNVSTSKSSSKPNDSLSVTNENIQPKNISKETVDRNQHPSLPQVFSDDGGTGRDMIYNVKPEFRCVFIKKKIQFIPPVYTQRYMEIERILKEGTWASNVKKVVDFGCSELSFEKKYLKKLNGIEEIIAVDIDSETLQNNCCKVSPSPCDYLDMRPTPLTVRVFCGSVAHTNDSLVGADAVIAIELIEHLFPPELENLPFTVFGFIKPRIAMFTTPNSDFNVMFKGMTGFRHPDHKFEWSRQQFEDWALNLVQRYSDYQVKFKGIGPGPRGSEKIGCCSQMATFIRVNECCSISPDEIHVQEGPYTLISENIFPFFKDERTEEEKISDSADRFLTHCTLRSRLYSELESEIPIEAVMGGIKFFNKDKLKEILIKRNWEMRENSSGEEVIVLPDSEGEEEESEANEYLTDNCDVNSSYENYLPEIEENWDNLDVDVDMDLTLTNAPCNVESNPCRESSDAHDLVTEEDHHGLDTVNSSAECGHSTSNQQLVSNDLGVSFTEKCSTPETTVPDSDLYVKLNSSLVEGVSEKDTNLNFENSVYGTPHNNIFCNGLKSDCDLCDCLPLSNQAAKDCTKALIMDSPKEVIQLDSNSHIEDPPLSFTCDTSIYATPCCSQRHRNNIPKCLSLQQISSCCGSPAFNTELDATLKEGKLIRDLTDKLSKSIDGVKSLENDLTCSSTSRVADSGYPDSNSEYNMDMDLTPEQFDEIETESEENDASSRSMSPPPLLPQNPRLFDDVQNGDVANNNRDGEGNNLVADMEEEALEFEARIDEINNEVLNLAAANDERYVDFEMQPSDQVEGYCGDCLLRLSDLSSTTDTTNDHQCMSETANIDSSKKYVFTELNTDSVFNDSSDKKSLRSTKSDTSIAPNCSLNLDPSESDKSRAGKGSYGNKTQNRKLKTFNSLTTILDGSSKFSNCSLVHPVEVYQVTVSNSPDILPKPVPSGSSDPVQQEDTQRVRSTGSSTSAFLEDCLSLHSVYQSAESLNHPRQLQEEQNNETVMFPDWLLNILNLYVEVNEVEGADSLQSVWDSDSMDERLGQNYDVQVDARGGGDPQRDSWH